MLSLIKEAQQAQYHTRSLILQSRSVALTAALWRGKNHHLQSKYYPLIKLRTIIENFNTWEKDAQI